MNIRFLIGTGLLVLCLLSYSASATYAVHGKDYKHLECSSCLAVARVLGDRMNASLKHAGSYRVSQRTDQNNNVLRRDYRTGELRSVEVLDNLCNTAAFSLFVLRLDTLTKVRGYHKKSFDAMKEYNRTALLEGIPHSSLTAEDIKAVADEVEIGMLPLAKLYTTKENEALRDLYRMAPGALCAELVSEFDDEMSTIVRFAETLTTVEEQLCGLKHTAGAEGVWNGLDAPVCNFCADAAGIQADARRDQQRWVHYNKVMSARKAAAEAKKQAAIEEEDAERRRLKKLPRKRPSGPEVQLDDL